MKKYWKIGLVAVPLASFVLFAISHEPPSPFIEMEVKGVKVDSIGQSPVVFLADKEEKKVLPIWIGLLEANAIDKELKNITSPRPMTHDLLHSILTQAQVKVKEIKIVDLKDHTYYATLYLKLTKGVIEVDARPSDAIILALKSKVPIFVSAKIVDEQAILLPPKSAFGERYGMRIQELTPSLASHFHFKGKKGVLVAEVLPGSVSETSGIKAGDVLTQVNSKEMEGVQDFEEIFDSLEAGDKVKIFLFREGKFQEIDLFLRP
ncbi:MAG: bifunctional nuclease family protein [Syntrophaceae bacterium]|nr:bifunctional nuclease family protein [Syntrophaceae bacterium]